MCKAEFVTVDYDLPIRDHQSSLYQYVFGNG